MTDLAIRVENLTRDFEADSGRVRAVDAMSLEVPPGIIFGFLGPNGAGKTTMIRLLLGLLQPTSGRAEVLGLDTLTRADEIRAQSGALHEHPGIYEQLSAEDNLEFYGRVWRLPKAERKARIKELLTQMGLWERRRDRSGKWSRGMRQKLALARTLMHRPSLVLLDEPTAGLDVPTATTVREDLASLTSREGTTVFLTTHNMSEAERLCSRVGVIRQGKLVAVGHPDELRARASGPRIEIVGRGFTEEALALLRAQPQVVTAERQNGRLAVDVRRHTEAAPLVSLLVDLGVQVEEVRREKASLEEVFLALMDADTHPEEGGR
jgi:ABC-2 type transport system ATP-binding protein